MSVISDIGQLFDEDQYICKGEYRITVTKGRVPRITGEFTIDETERRKPEVLNALNLSGRIKILHLRDGATLRCRFNLLRPETDGKCKFVPTSENAGQIRKLTP
jgi:hypothetical protein